MSASIFTRPNRSMCFMAASICVTASALANDAPPAQVTQRSTKEQTVAYVQLLIDTMTKLGTDKAFAEFNKLDSPMNTTSVVNPNGDLYALVYMKDGLQPVHGKNSKIPSKNVFTMRDVNGVPLIQNMINLCWSKKGHGWTSYVWPHSITKENAIKLTYVQRAGDYCVGAGIYK